MDITTGSQEMKKTLLITRWTGLTAGTSAESTAWTWSAWRHHQNTSLSRSLSRTMISPMSGHQADSATSRAVTERTCSHQQLTDGSGQAPVSRWLPLTPPHPAGATNHGPSLVTRLSLSHTMCHSLTTLSLTSMAVWRPVWEFSMTSMMTASNGTILPAITQNHSSAKILTNCWNMSKL